MMRMNVGKLYGTVALCMAFSCATPKSEFRMAQQQDTVEAYEHFLKQYPSSGYSSKAEQRMEQLCWNDATASRTKSGYEKYLGIYPEGEHAKEARRRIDLLSIHVLETRASSTIPQLPTASLSIIVNDAVKALGIEVADSEGGAVLAVTCTSSPHRKCLPLAQMNWDTGRMEPMCITTQQCKCELKLLRAPDLQDTSSDLLGVDCPEQMGKDATANTRLRRRIAHLLRPAD